MERQGFVFPGGPQWLTGVDDLRELWSLTGRDLAGDVGLRRVESSTIFRWTDGKTIELPLSDGMGGPVGSAMTPADVAGFHACVEHGAALRLEQDRAGIARTGRLANAPDLIRNRSWQTIRRAIAAFVPDRHLGDALAALSFAQGANPFQAGALLGFDLKRARSQGIWAVSGGLGALFDGLRRSSSGRAGRCNWAALSRTSRRSAIGRWRC